MLGGHGARAKQSPIMCGRNVSCDIPQSWMSSSDSDPEDSTERRCPGIRYCPDAHVPRSITWHRFEQNGRQGLPSHVVGLRQLGQVMADVLLEAGRDHSTVER